MKVSRTLEQMMRVVHGRTMKMQNSMTTIQRC